MEVRCPNCGWTSELTPEAISAAIAAAEQKQADYHIEHCPRCQWVIRVPLDELRAAAAAPTPVLESPAVPAPVEPVAEPVPQLPPAARVLKRKHAPAKPKAAAKKAPAKKAAAKPKKTAAKAKPKKAAKPKAKK
jgi:hypothetical protein